MSKIDGIKIWKEQFPEDFADAKRQGKINSIAETMGWKFKTPSSYWSKEKCIENALLYTKITHWRRNSETAYKSAKKNGWYEDCIIHMVNLTKPKGYWDNKGHCLEDALKYQTKSKWSKFSDSAYKSAKKNGWFKEATAHMIEGCKPNGYWTKERCIEEAKKYQTKIKWKDNSGSSYSVACQNKWVYECTKHMIEKRHSVGYWTKERCLEDALKYETRFEWQKSNHGSYGAAFRDGFLDECCTHMVSGLTKKNKKW